MLIKPTIDELEKKVDGDRYALVHLASRRSRDLREGKQPLMYIENNKPVSLAAREIGEGLISLKWEDGEDREVE